MTVSSVALTAAGRAAFYTENRAQRRLARARKGVLSHAKERLREADGDGGLAFSGRRGRNGGYEDELAIRFLRESFQ